MDILPIISTEVDSWHILVDGHLKWNRYFGETSDNPPRKDPSTCSSVLICGKKANGSVYRLIVDPTTRHNAEEYYFDLNRRTGLHPEDITHCFSTHHHFDHWNGFKYFPDAVWCTTKENVSLIIEASKKIKINGGDVCDACMELFAKKLQVVEGEFLPGVYAILLPGHTPFLYGIAFRSEGKRILVASDSVMSRQHFKNGTTEFQPDPALQLVAAETIHNIKESFDIVIPGHDMLIVL